MEKPNEEAESCITLPVTDDILPSSTQTKMKRFS